MRARFWPLMLGTLISLGLWISPKAVQANPMDDYILKVIRENPEVINETLVKYQQQQKELAQAEQVQKVHNVFANPKTLIGDSPRIGSLESDLILTIFSDFECPFCAAAEKEIEAFLPDHPNVTYVFKNFPLVSIHDNALDAAKAAWAAHQQSKFFEFQRILFENQSELGEELYLSTASDLQLDLEQFNRDRNSEKALEVIQADVELGRQIGVNGTPFILVNDEIFDQPVTAETLKQLVKESEAVQ